MLRLRLTLPGAMVFFSACVSPHAAKPVTLPNGHQGYAVHCNGTHHDVGDCMNEAAQTCGGPYQVLTENGETVGSVGMAMPAGNGATAVTVHGIHRTMIFECGAPAAPPASSSR